MATPPASGSSVRPADPPPADPRSQRFPRAVRLVRREDFDRVLRDGLRQADERLVVWAAPNDLPHARLGLIVGRRFGGAERRNAARRRLREAFRRSPNVRALPYDFVCAPAAGRDLSAREAVESLERAVERLVRRFARRG